MTVEEIKKNNPMPDIVKRYGFRINRAGFISCPFHTGDHTASMKIYPDSFHCFGCQLNGDIFTFVMKMDDCDFKTAFYTLGGTYNHLSGNERKHAIRDAESARRKRIEAEAKARQARQEELFEINGWIKFHRFMTEIYPPLSDTWCYHKKKLDHRLYQFETVWEEMFP